MQRSRDDYLVRSQVSMYHERCPCGAEFTVSLTYDAGNAINEMRVNEARDEHHSWQSEHALVCDTMLRAIQPRAERIKEFHKKQEQEAAERRRKAQEAAARSRAKRQARA